MKQLWIGLSFLLLFGGIRGPDVSMAGDRQKGVGKVSLKWAFAALKESSSGSELVAIHRETALSTGDEFKMLLELKDKCYAYVIYQGPRQEIRLLFPYALSDFEKGLDESKPYYIPKGHGWFELDDVKGSMAFHLVVSVQRLTRLETLLNNYESARSGEKQAVAGDLLEEMRQLKRLNTSLKAPAERPAQIIGRVRGNGEPEQTDIRDIENLAVEISAENFFSRTFTIDHK